MLRNVCDGESFRMLIRTRFKQTMMQELRREHYVLRESKHQMHDEDFHWCCDAL
jgi:hypothetical protein